MISCTAYKYLFKDEITEFCYSDLLKTVQGAPFKFTGFLKLLFSVNSEATDLCNTAIEQKFC